MPEQGMDLVLEGGGVKGIALVGAISVLYERGYRVRRVAGTSAGSIVGALVAAGFTAQEMQAEMAQVDYEKFQDGDLLDHLLVGKMFEIVAAHGIYRGQYLKDWLGGLLERKGVRTFADLPYTDPDPARQPPPGLAYRLVVNVSDLSAGMLRQLPWDYLDHYGLPAADQRVVDAVRGSMSIPFFFRPARLADKSGAEHWIVDGGMLSNFPIDLFDCQPGSEPRWPTFGIKLSVKPDAVRQGLVNSIHDTPSMTMAMLNTLTGFYDRMHVEDASVTARTIFVDTLGVKATDFDLQPATRDALFASGQQAARKFLDGADGQPGWDFEEYKRKYRT